MTEWVQHNGQHLAILLLDFERACDNTDWLLLEGTLVRLGFPSAWIMGIFALYMMVSSRVIIGGRMGRDFT